MWTPEAVTNIVALVGLFAVHGIKLWSDRTPKQ